MMNRYFKGNPTIDRSKRENKVLNDQRSSNQEISMKTKRGYVELKPLIQELFKFDQSS